MSDKKYIAVDAKPVHIIKRCEDRSCDRYHLWVKFDMTAAYYEAAQIVTALNKDTNT